jgi:hypothetical protein
MTNTQIIYETIRNGKLKCHEEDSKKREKVSEKGRQKRHKEKKERTRKNKKKESKTERRK